MSPTESEDYYLTPDGLLVFTEAYHLKRGHCCKSGCRHCPYPEKKPDAEQVNELNEFEEEKEKD